MQKIRKAVIPAAGLGTRVLPATKAMPKEMLPIVDKPAIQYIVEEAVAAGIEEILIVSGHGKRAIEDHFDSAPTLEAELKKKGAVINTLTDQEKWPQMCKPVYEKYGAAFTATIDKILATK